MPLSKVEFKAGINKEETDYSNEGGWVDGNLIRFRKNRVEKIGGWVKYSTNSFLGICRALHQWISLGGSRYMGLGTTLKYYVEEGGSYNDVTPIRSTTSAGDVTFSASNGDATITVTDTAHGAVQNDFVTFSGASSLGGNIIASVLNQEYQIATIVNANSYTVEAKDTSGATVTANASDSGNGGSSVVGAYQVNVGLDNYVQGTGWGLNSWGDGGFGSSSSISAQNQLRLWTHDNFGEDLIINVRGGGIYRWVENNGVGTRAVQLSSVSGANKVPTVGLQVVTSETDRHLIVLGADPIESGSRSGVVDPMLVAFSDQENALEFEPTSTNTAGSLRLSSGSQIVGGMKSRQEVLIWTDTSIYSMNFIGPPLTFSLNLINEGAGLIGPKAFVNAPNGVFYMSKQGFYFYNGAVQKLSCSVQEYVFQDLDQSQAFKCHVALNAEFSEVWFFYPSISDDTREISRYAMYNYQENNWSIGSMVRYAWLDSGIKNRPQASGASSSTYYIYEHENGFNDDESPMDNVYIESADIDLQDGQNLAFVKRIIPDVKFVTQTGTSPDPAVNIVLKNRDFNGESLTTNSTNQIKTTTNQSFVRARGRQFVLRFESDDDNNTEDRKDYKWRVGSTRIDIQPSGRRGA
tara:strand:+ start:623 stop:2524 length:1902 start_codon:yes stop_codon:yes gene_type:complete